jgi:hypothetical protein
MMLFVVLHLYYHSLDVAQLDKFIISKVVKGLLAALQLNMYLGWDCAPNKTRVKALGEATKATLAWAICALNTRWQGLGQGRKEWCN